MLIRSFITVLFLVLSFQVKALTPVKKNGVGSLFEFNQPVSKSTNLGPLAIGYDFCQQINRIAPILEAYSNVQWPIMGVPGFTFGLVQNDSVVMEICDFLIKLESLDTEGAIFHTARALNEITGLKWDSHLAQADLTWNVANSLYDFRGNGGFRQGALTSAQTHRQLIDFANRTKKFYKKRNAKPGDPDPEGIETRQQRQEKLQKVATLSYNRSILSEAMACPVAETKTNNQELWQKTMIPEQDNVKKRKNNVDHYRNMMITKMGPDFIVDVDKLQAYKNDTEALVDKGFSFDYTINYVDTPRKTATGKLDSDGIPVTKETKEKRPYQLIRVVENTQLWNDYKNKYASKWKQYIQDGTMTNGIMGLFDDKKGRIEAKYKVYTWECSETQLSDKLTIKDKNDPQYSVELQKAVVDCQDKIKYREKEAESLLERYIRLLQDDLRSAKNSQAKMWSFESKYIGTMPLEKNSTNAADAKAQEVIQMKAMQAGKKECRAEFSPAEMEKLKLELDSVNSELNQQILENQVQKTEMEAAKMQAQSENMDATVEQAKKNDNMIRRASKPVAQPGLDLKNKSGL